jgi:DNA-binding MarR family transcriptional regulator
MSSRNAKREMSDPASVSSRSRELLGVLGLLGMGMKRWARSNLPTRGEMTVPRASTLLGLANKHERLSMSDLGEFLGMSPRNMTVLVDGLEKERLVQRVPHERDRRITLVEITEEGKHLVETALAPSQLVTAGLFEDLTSEEQTELLRLLVKLLDSLRARGIEVPMHDQK